MPSPIKAITMPTASLYILTLSLIYSIVSHFFPNMDLIISSYFYEPNYGFPLKDLTILKIWRNIIYFSPVIICAFALFAFCLHKMKFNFKLLSAHQVKFILTTYIIAGLAIPQILKHIFKRPRPIFTNFFGGPLDFTPAWSINHTAVSYSWSFPSAESAFAMCLISLAMCIKDQTTRNWAINIGFLIAIFSSFSRVMFGAHYLSDITTSWAIVLILIPFIWHFTKKYKIFNY